jgi:hypothetical protein
MGTRLWIIYPDASPLIQGAERLLQCAQQSGWEGTLISAQELAQQPNRVLQGEILPLTLDLPPLAAWSGAALWQRCRQPDQLRAEVVAALGGQAGVGQLWLPLVNTARGLLFGEAIARDATGNWMQPLHLSDPIRQPLYDFGQRLRRYLNLPPGVHLMAAEVQAGDVVFEQLLPFPGEPALASLGVQQPDLFSAHWQCLRGQPLLDLQIPAAPPSGQ